ncbi:MAG: hypothetical protein ABJB74_15545 [Gemmatimonas sp.]
MMPASLETYVSKSFMAVALWIALGSTIFVSPAHAQTSPHPVSFDGGTGFYSAVAGGAFNQRAGPSVFVQLTGKVLNGSSRSLLAAANFSVFANLPNEDCVVPRDSNGEFTVGCLKDFPEGRLISALVGVEQRLGNNLSLRLFAGPTLFRPFHDHGKYGTLTRVDIAVPASSRGAFVVWAQGGFLPIQNSTRGRVMMAGLGLRVK